uniref:Expansin-like EG45 domain-containing protein n=1 Tax=Leersia perrieri TaxID=77586 RepID=A0A0D9WUA2_9ORYZ
MELNVAAVTADLFRDGHACGACYQLRCRDRRLCGEDGVKVVVTDLIKQSDIQDTNRTAAAASLQFRVTKDAFAAMARQGVSADELTSNQHTAVEIDFRRTPCEYKKSLAVKVEETSKNPTHLAFRLLYQGGQTDIAAVEIAPAKSATAWRYMTRRRRRVWSTPRAPAGALRVRVVVTGGSGGKWVMSDGEVIPAEWKPGEVYDTGMRVTDIAARSCEVSCGGVEDSDGDEEEELR